VGLLGTSGNQPGCEFTNPNAVQRRQSMQTSDWLKVGRMLMVSYCQIGRPFYALTLLTDVI